MTKPYKEINTTLASTPFLGKKLLELLRFTTYITDCRQIYWNSCASILTDCRQMSFKRFFQVVCVLTKMGFLKSGVSLFDQLFVVSEA